MSEIRYLLSKGNFGGRTLQCLHDMELLREVGRLKRFTGRLQSRWHERDILAYDVMFDRWRLYLYICIYIYIHMFYLDDWRTPPHPRLASGTEGGGYTLGRAPSFGLAWWCHHIIPYIFREARVIHI